MTILTLDTKDWRILAVDDRQDNLKLLVATLQHYRASVLAIADSREVLSRVTDFKPNIALLDLAMPHINGWSLFSALRQEEICANIPIIAVTALAMQEDVRRAKEMGFNGYIIKPYTVDGVMTALKTCVGGFIRHGNETFFNSGIS